jgi:phage terminase small subunit
MDRSFVRDSSGKRSVPRLFTRAPRGQKIRNARATRLANRLLEVCPWLKPIDTPMLRAFAELETLAAECYAKIVADGVYKADGRPHPLLVEHRSIRRAQLEVAARLGFTPADRERMKATSAAAALDGVDYAKIDRILKRVNGKGLTSESVEASDEPQGDADHGKPPAANA